MFFKETCTYKRYCFSRLNGNRGYISSVWFPIEITYVFLKLRCESSAFFHSCIRNCPPNMAGKWSFGMEYTPLKRRTDNTVSGTLVQPRTFLRTHLRSQVGFESSQCLSFDDHQGGGRSKSRHAIIMILLFLNVRLIEIPGM